MEKIDNFLELIIAEGDYTGLWELSCGPSGDITNTSEEEKAEIRKGVSRLVQSRELLVFSSNWPPDRMVELEMNEALCTLKKLRNWEWPSNTEDKIYWVAAA